MAKVKVRVAAKVKARVVAKAKARVSPVRARRRPRSRLRNSLSSKPPLAQTPILEVKEVMISSPRSMLKL